MRKQIKIKGCTLSYVEKNSKAERIIFFVHGNSSSAKIWFKQFNSSQLSDYRLVAFDLPAHGESGELTPDNYHLLYFASLLSEAILEVANGKEYILAGFSFGANLVSELLAHNLKPKGIVLLGPSIIGGSITLTHVFKDGADLSPLFTENSNRQAIEIFFKGGLDSGDESDVKQIADDYFTTKAPFRAAIFQSAIDTMYSDEIALLKEYNLPLLIILGKEDSFVNIHYLDEAGLPLWNEKIYLLAGGNHFIHIDQPEQVNQLIAEYAQDVYT